MLDVAQQMIWPSAFFLSSSIHAQHQPQPNALPKRSSQRQGYVEPTLGSSSPLRDSIFASHMGCRLPGGGTGWWCLPHVYGGWIHFLPSACSGAGVKQPNLIHALHGVAPPLIPTRACLQTTPLPCLGVPKRRVDEWRSCDHRSSPCSDHGQNFHIFVPPPFQRRS